ncbi:MAG: V-type ATP synthase subunit B [Deltaproteobacteria bacterium]|nr:MAG: V-type ATP synthase subunit B [Deltaproteobacteria bacterium]
MATLPRPTGVRVCAPDHVLGLKGNVLRIDATGLMPFTGELCEVSWGDDSSSFGRVIAFEGSETLVQVYNGTLGVARNATVTLSGKAQELTFSPGTLGRVFSGAGVPLDGKAAPKGKSVPIGTPSVNPMHREMPSQFVETGVPMIDIFNSLVASQKIPIFSVPGEAYNDLLVRIAGKADADVIVFGAMGFTPAEYDRVMELLRTQGALSKSVVYAHTTADSTAECLMTPDMVLSTAENYALEGKDVLVLLSDFTEYANALKSMQNDMGQIPAERGFPGNLYTQLARRYEKACDFRGAGSITILAVTTMPNADFTHPVPDNTGYITEGQFYLLNGMLDPFRSLSRLKQNVNKDTREDHRGIMTAMVRLYANARTAKEKADMGHELNRRDKRLLSFAEAFETRLMRLEVTMPLHAALDTCWEILRNNFDRTELPLDQHLLDNYWNK